MAFTVKDYHDLVSLLYERPEWRAKLRQLILSEEFLDLPKALQNLAEAQARTEQRVKELAEAQKRTEQRVEELAELQAATRSELRNLSERVGATVEEEAEGVLRVVLEQQGYRLAGEPFNLNVNGEVDVVLPLLDAEGKPLWAVVKAKTRLGWRAVEAWAQRMHSPDFQARLQEEGVAGPYLVYVYGMRVDVSARQSAEKFGIGVASSQGEQVAPGGVVEAQPQD